MVGFCFNISVHTYLKNHLTDIKIFDTYYEKTLGGIKRHGLRKKDYKEIRGANRTCQINWKGPKHGPILGKEWQYTHEMAH